MPRGKSKPPVCLCGECGGPVHCRGLALGCYHAAARKVRAGDTTWDELVAAGLALAAKKVNETRRSPMTKKIAALAASRG